MTLDIAAAWLKSTSAYQAFDKARRESVREALRAAIREGSVNDAAWIDAATDKHLAAVADAGLPVMKILKLVGASTLMKIAASMQGEAKP